MEVAWDGTRDAVSLLGDRPSRPPTWIDQHAPNLRQEGFSSERDQARRRKHAAIERASRQRREQRAT